MFIKLIGMQLVILGNAPPEKKENIAKTMKKYKGPASNYASTNLVPQRNGPFFHLFCVIVSDDNLSVFFSF